MDDLLTFKWNLVIILSLSLAIFIFLFISVFYFLRLVPDFKTYKRLLIVPLIILVITFLGSIIAEKLDNKFIKKAEQRLEHISESLTTDPPSRSNIISLVYKNPYESRKKFDGDSAGLFLYNYNNLEFEGILTFDAEYEKQEEFELSLEPLEKQLVTSLSLWNDEDYQIIYQGRFKLSEDMMNKMDKKAEEFSRRTSIYVLADYYPPLYGKKYVHDIYFGNNGTDNLEGDVKVQLLRENKVLAESVFPVSLSPDEKGWLGEIVADQRYDYVKWEILKD